MSRSPLGTRLRRALTGSVVTAAAGVLAAGLFIAPGATPRAEDGPPTEVRAQISTVASATNPATPGDFTGYGFDQCLAPSQAAMDAWLEHSPYLAVGIYISGNSRFCRDQPNLTPAWVATQLAKGWRLLPITLGPQSTCVGRFPRYGAKIDPTIVNGDAAAARAQGVTEADTAVNAAGALGIVPGSTLWYDLEGWSNYKDATCRESALAFLSGWTQRVHDHGYVSGVYSSAGSGMKILDDARKQGRADVVLPDRIWIARWDGQANTSTTYIAEDGWRPGNRMKQYRGGHDETWGGVTINIDSNFLELGAGLTAAPETHCGGVPVDFPAYTKLKPGTTDKARVKALKCLLSERGAYAGKAKGKYNKSLVAAVRAWQGANGLKQKDTWSKKNWKRLFAGGARPVLKFGSTGPAVRDLQRALNTSIKGLALPVDGVYARATENAVKRFQKTKKLGKSGVANTATWAALAR